MPSITVKTEYVVKLKQLGVYDKWLANVQYQWGDWLLQGQLSDSGSWATFIRNSFGFVQSPEKFDFWDIVTKK